VYSNLQHQGVRSTTKRFADTTKVASVIKTTHFYEFFNDYNFQELCTANTGHNA
jgi:hypothetical protein